MIFMRILPGVLKELMKHVPTVLFSAVEWSELASEIPKLSRRIIQKEGHDELLQKQKEYLKPWGIELVNEVDHHFQFNKNQAAAEAILTLYFAQLFSPHGLFLDLRPNHLDMQHDQLRWHPTGLWTKFSKEFYQGLYDIYDGFYQDNEALYHQGLLKLGLVSPDWSQEERIKLAELFKAQFGSSLEEGMIFELDAFKDSLLKVAHFLLEKRVKISTDFLYLGIYLVTMYSAMEKTKVKINVKQTYLKVREALKS
jgi:predicted unusual protein kinase regulating ubiquinone biosynthesis (AarF/ABC1/UbiB family)